MRYLDMLPDLVYSYSHNEHRSIGRQPALVNSENEDEVFHTLYHNVLDNVQLVKLGCFRFICCIVVVMSGTHFYLKLPSNASLDAFPDNKTTSYHVKLLQSIDLEGNWEVGLYSISYPNTWYTLQDSFDTHMYYADRSGLFLTTILDNGYYSSMEGLIKATNTAIAKNVNDNIVLTYNSVTGKVEVKLQNGYQLGLDYQSCLDLEERIRRS